MSYRPIKKFKAERARAKRRKKWDRFGSDVQTVGTGVGIVATLATGLALAINTGAGAKTKKEVSREDALVALSIDAQTAYKGARSASHRRKARKTRKAAERAMESLAARSATAEADYARAIAEGVAMHRTAPRPEPVWWPKDV